MQYSTCIQSFSAKMAKLWLNGILSGHQADADQSHGPLSLLLGFGINERPTYFICIVYHYLNRKGIVSITLKSPVPIYSLDINPADPFARNEVLNSI